MASAWKADRVGSATTTIFAEMSALALATQSVNLGQGFPDTDGPDFMLDEARAAIAGGVNQYPPGRGIRPLREAIAEHSQPALRAELRPGDGGLGHHRRHRGTRRSDHGLRQSGRRGDRAGAVLRLLRGVDRARRRPAGRESALFGPDFTLDHAELAAAFTPRTKALLINTPHNPTGAVLDRTDLGEIARNWP